MCDKTIDRLREIFRKALRIPDGQEIPVDRGLVRLLGIDSVSTMEILIWVEDDFGVVIEDADLSPALVDSFEVLASYIEKARRSSPTEVAT